MKWRCKSNGVIIELDDRETKGMLDHDGYEAVECEKKISGVVTEEVSVKLSTDPIDSSNSKKEKESSSAPTKKVSTKAKGGKKKTKKTSKAA